MTTTMVRMRDTVDLVKQRGLGVDVMVGGAVVTPAFAESIGANYSSDAWTPCGSPRASSRPARTSNPKEQPCAVFPA